MIDGGIVEATEMHQSNLGTRARSARQGRQLSPLERASADAFVAHLRERYGDDLRNVVLFGSRARGDANDDSDFDFLVILQIPPGTYWQNWRIVADIAWEVELATGAAISVILKSPEAYHEMVQRKPLLVREIERDGIRLWTSKLGAPTFVSV